MRTTGKSVAALGVLCAVLCGTGAFAQSALPGENGIKVGEGRVHPFFDLELRFDSAAVAANGQSFGDMIAHFRPGLRMEVPGSSVYLLLSGNADYVLYTGLVTSSARNASHLEGAVNLDLAFNRDGAVEFRVQDQFARTDRTTNPALGVGVVSLYNQAKVSLPIHPGGQALEIAPSASFTVEFFDPLLANQPGGPAASTFNYTQLGFALNGRYKFLPKTALVLDADFLMPTYAAGGTQMLLVASAGLSGLLSPKFSVIAKAGWGHSFTSPAKTIIAHVELAYLASQTATVKLGYLRTLQPIAVFNTFQDDRGYLEGRALLGGRLTLRGYGAFDLISYTGAAGGADTNVRLDLGPEYQFTRWLVGAAGYVLSIRTSPVSGDYNRHEGYVRLTLTY